MTPEHQAILDRLRTSAASVMRAIETVPRDGFTRPPCEGEWSAKETLTHLRDVVVHVQGLRKSSGSRITKGYYLDGDPPPLPHVGVSVQA